MHFSSAITQGLLAVGVAASRGHRFRRQVRPGAPTDPGIPSDCTYYDTYVDPTYDCAMWAADWRITLEQFVNYNPTVKDDCSGIQVGHAYCVEVNNGMPPDGEEESKVTTTEDAEPEPTEDSKPSPTQDGLIESCTTFYKAKKGDTCTKIIAQYKSFDFADFFKWNPAVEDDCSGIWAETWYCVGVPGTPTKPPTQTAVTTTPASQTGGIETPSPIQEGLVKNCNKFHLVKSTTTCVSIEQYYELPIAQFTAWNPAVGKDCKGLWADYWVCVSVEGYKPSTTTTAKATTTTKTPSNGIETPSPVQAGITKNCNKFHLVKSTTTCASIESYYKLPLAQFTSWNPAVGKDCKGLWADYWVCVSVVGFVPITTTAKPTTTTKVPGNGIKTPSPIQTGMVTNCNKFHPVSSTTTCASIQSYYDITLADFVKWNPAVGKDCKGLWANYNVCVGVIGGTPTKPGNGIETPSPIQAGMVSNCKKFHPVSSTTTCASIQKYYKITMAQLAKWNPAVGSKCTALWANYYVCVGV
ncbi:hypothetical protein NM208_g2698 [Fusarium decemcellulare]|uniref:Uncharacterized protein n=1 Tax=Fusarium decemcellulare TaxID=57161 RepID=A0ACC1SRT2_9HYPO|nr:hypothetical protein NM208_g2698 [Fusarium decemcellulare]